MMSDEYDPGSLDDSSSSSSCRKRRRRGGGITLGGGRLFPGLKEYVVHLLTFRSENYSDTDFAERTLMNLGRKITKYGDSELSEWEKCVRLRDPNTNCVRVARPRDSRMAVSRTPGGGVKKVYPAIIVSQIFRFPQVVFHNDIRSVRECAHQAPVKKERPPSDESEDLICVNPYHYEMTLEAYARLKKKQTKPQTQWQNESNSSNNSETTPRPRPFIESELIRDLQLYDLNKRKAIQDLESLKLLGIRNGIRSVVKEKYPKLPVQDSDGPVDEGLIQNLLEDIRGSFERQFDDDLNALATNSVMSGTFPYPPQESPWNQHQPPAAFPGVGGGGGGGAAPGHPPHPPEWNASNYLNVDFDHYFPPGGPHHPHPPHSMSSYHHLPQQSVFNYDNQNHASTSYTPYDSAAAHGSLQ